MSNQLTPMQEAIDKVASYKYGNFLSKDYIINILTELLPKEQQVIYDAYWDGGQDIPLTDAKCKEYYNTKFKQNGK